MFAQVIQGHVSDAEQMHARLDQWMRDLAPGAQGWLGCTCGVTDDQMFISIVRFNSEADAMRNSNRPEQDAWWRETEKLFTDTPMFHNCDNCEVDLHGDPDSAGFVQIMEGKSTDPARARELMGQHRDEWAAFRPDVIGMLEADYSDGGFTTEMFFTSEAEARQNEQKEPPAELKADMDQMMALADGPVRFYDLHKPWMYSAN